MPVTDNSQLKAAVDEAVIAALRIARARGRSDEAALTEVAAELADMLGSVIAGVARDERGLQRALVDVCTEVEAQARRMHAALGRSKGTPRW
jgi:hypothetical protein